MAATKSADYWNGVRENFTDLLFDYGRRRLVDVEGANDDRNLTDRVDNGAGSQATLTGAVPWGTVLVIGVLVIVGVVVAKRVL